MEFWARWAHRALWHASLWHMHESHHRPRDGPFELNDVFAIVNAVPAMALLAFGFFNRGLVPGLCFGAVRSNFQFPSSAQTTPAHTPVLCLCVPWEEHKCWFPPLSPCGGGAIVAHAAAHRQTTTPRTARPTPISYPS
jgi:hypothetical protein